MSCSSLWVVKPDYTGECLTDYHNSWWFSPIVWNVLSDKYLARDRYGYIQSIIGPNGNEVHSKINKIMNCSKNTYERVCWEISNQQVFFAKDKELIVASIHKFLEENKTYDVSTNDGIAILQRKHIIERFNEIAEDILALDENEYPYFIFKNTSVDDGVECLFSKYDEEMGEYVDSSLKELDKYKTEFVIIEDEEIKKFVSNLDFNY